ncbi:hypothetical protein PT226_05320 [Erysipelothrix rhusiopathiae]|uniref:Tetratricopeptide repeat protein n=1 Tax=Erysipelothrix rhusiopathiae ATCC 19414 TaxID=525280 RepID=E7FTT7_ERYRH|nr:hypothetical protein [Erysipelothrix rhusiopathiae]EFY09426.1 hypothetical protein HMPREF0357_10221 [Erysipelothrix rhusiopathiae ATCC 19414]MDE8032850.1 hypothetical protein [Erysipelothrix rhusiopathiae]MDE8037330.1 hypothetical protein [Erysipelothrix rhusiopathiae]MDE8050634.1 hypothetical protein [Erysipelothrix rhusiopathiae]MDE8055306.1 hypothetical protein [Erysipelothrix rhusiopathiae]
MDYLKIFMIFVVAFIAIQLLIRLLGKKASDKAMKAFMESDTPTFTKNIDSWLAKLTIPTFNRNFFKLNYFMSVNDSEQVQSIAQGMEKLHMNRNQKLEYLMKLYEYALMRDEVESTKQALEALRTFIRESDMDNRTQLLEKLDLDESIFINHDMDSLAAIDTLIEQSPEELKGVWYFRKAMILEENGHDQRALTEIERAMRHEPLEINKEQYQVLKDQILKK